MHNDFDPLLKKRDEIWLSVSESGPSSPVFELFDALTALSCVYSNEAYIFPLLPGWSMCLSHGNRVTKFATEDPEK